MKNAVITIAREYGSGGRKIGELVAERLGIPFYDKEIIALTAQKSGFAEDFIKANEERTHSSLIYSLYMHSAIPNVFDQAAIAEANVIRELAEKGSCVIVGRAADSIVDKGKSIRVFVYAPIESRIRRVEGEYGLKVSDTRRYIDKTDRERSAFYNFTSNKKWGDTRNYHLTLNSDVGVETAANLIVEYAKAFELK